MVSELHLVDKMSREFPYTDESHVDFETWRQNYHNMMYLKHGSNAKAVHEDKFLLETDEGRKVLVVLQTELFKDGNDGPEGTIPPPAEGG